MNIDYSFKFFLHLYQYLMSVLKGQGYDFAVFFMGHITEIFNYVSQNDSAILEYGLLSFVEKQTKHSYVV